MGRFAIEPIWDGRAVVIIGGGPSLSLQHVHTVAKKRLELGSNLRVMAINNSVYVAWWADWLHACDWKWWNAHVQCVRGFAGMKTTLDPMVSPKWVSGILENSGEIGFDERPWACRTGGNSVYQAMHCAIHAGVKKIVLLGVDMKLGPAGETHWHGGHPNGLTTSYSRTMLPHFETLKPALKERGISVINASPCSALTTFVHMPVEQALA